ncbi:MAG TPA: cysteine--tRNA ligase [Symbiobacteriaceae bacterium]|nr:cysteine--tRNA ligase [Symbiobacteriaceae bacterium]
MRIFNDLTRQKEEFVPLEPGKVRFYNCGPTVYGYFHIGNGRNFVVMDTIRRYLMYRGYDVTFVQNFTDIDDKMINRANERGITVKQLADEMIAAYFEHAQALGVLPADIHPKATDLIGEQVAMIQELIDKGYAYAVEGGDVYYRVSRKLDYGKLSHKNLDDLLAGASERVDPDDRKEQPFDFALWKGQKPGEPAWEAPWGAGRPGWHIECSAMARRYLGDTIDIHGGGEDLVFPHHENEIAQSEACNDKPFARYWVHNAFLNIEGEKMSKSKNNFFTVTDILQEYEGEVVRLYLLGAHYRTQLDFRRELVDQTKAGLERMRNTVGNLQHVMRTAVEKQMTPDEAQLLGELSQARQRYVEAMDDDFNTAGATAVLFDLVREINSRVQPGASAELAEGALALLKELAGVLGMLTGAGAKEESLDDEIQALVDARQAARKAKNWAESDRIRDQLGAMGIILEDTPQGVRWKRK